MKKPSVLLMTVMLLAVFSCKKKDDDNDKPKPITKCFLTSITCNSIPFNKPTGGSWEDIPLVEQGPDVYFLLNTETDSTIYGSRDFRYDNVTKAHLPLVRMIPAPYVQFPVFNATYFLKVFDYDILGGDDEMGILGPVNPKELSAHPTSLVLTQDSLKVTLGLKWE